MSEQPDPIFNNLNTQKIQTIEQLNLTVMQKHHVRILAHCLFIIKDLVKKKSSTFDRDNLLREWCNNHSQKFNDQEFNNLLYKQLATTARKLDNFSQSIDKNIKDLEIEDLVLLVEQVEEN